MNGKIDKDGMLCLHRKNKYERMQCPVVTVQPRFCSDTCALFGEPLTEYAQGYDQKEKKKKQVKLTTLDLCHKTLVFEDFTDERE